MGEPEGKGGGMMESPGSLVPFYLFGVSTRLCSLPRFHLSLLDRAGTTTPFIWIPPTFPSTLLSASSPPQPSLAAEVNGRLHLGTFFSFSSSARSSARRMTHDYDEQGAHLEVDVKRWELIAWMGLCGQVLWSIVFWPVLLRFLGVWTVDNINSISCSIYTCPLLYCVTWLKAAVKSCLLYLLRAESIADPTRAIELKKKVRPSKRAVAGRSILAFVNIKPALVLKLVSSRVKSVFMLAKCRTSSGTGRLPPGWGEYVVNR